MTDHAPRAFFVAAVALMGFGSGALFGSYRGDRAEEPAIAPIPVDVQLALLTGREASLDAARDLGYAAIGSTCGLKRGDSVARCLVRAREPSSVEGDPNPVVTLNLGCGAQGCFLLESP